MSPHCSSEDCDEESFAEPTVWVLSTLNSIFHLLLLSSKWVVLRKIVSLYAMHRKYRENRKTQKKQTHA